MSDGDATHRQLASRCERRLSWVQIYLQRNSMSMNSKSKSVLRLVGIIAIVFSCNAVVAKTSQPSAGSPTTVVVLPDCEVELRGVLQGTKVIESRDPLVSPPSVAITVHRSGATFTFRLFCEEASSPPTEHDSFGTAGLTAIGARWKSGAWEPAIDGRYYANLKWAKPIKGRNWKGVLAYVEGWQGDGQNTGDRSLGFCAAPEYEVCGVAIESKNDAGDATGQALTPGTVAMLTEIFEGLAIRKRGSQ